MFEDVRFETAVSFWAWLEMRGRPGELARVQRRHGVDPGTAFDLLWQQREAELAGRLARHVSELPAEQRLLYEHIIDEFREESRRRRARRRYW